MKAQVKKIDFTGQNIYVGFDAAFEELESYNIAEDFVYKTFTQPQT